MNTFKQSAIEILKKAGRPLRCAEITRLALESGILETEGANPERTMAAVISVDIKTKKTGSDFVKTKPGFFVLNKNKEEITETPKIIEAEKVEEEKIIIEGGFIGKGGEHLVCSELLFRGFNASIMTVDVGIDIAAIKENKFFGIQVKTARINRFRTYNFYIRRSSFEKHNQDNIFYIFVLRHGDANKYLIISAKEIQKKIKERAISPVNGEIGYALHVKFRKGKIYLGNRNHEMSRFLENWDLIK